jgi:hypothetical protein
VSHVAPPQSAFDTHSTHVMLAVSQTGGRPLPQLVFVMHSTQ